jgi:hypothetical protein
MPKLHQSLFNLAVVGTASMLAARHGAANRFQRARGALTLER